MKINLAVPTIQKDSIVDGEGIRSVIWTQGCKHHCLGCHNPETHAFDKGIAVDVEDIKREIDALEGQDGITFSGGDPMEQASSCLEIAKYCHKKGLNIWCYTGYTFEELLKKAKSEEEINKFLECIDVLVDGRFILQKKSYDVIFRGSTNQRLIDVPKSLSQGKAITLSKYDEDINQKNIKKNHYMYV